MSKSPVRNPRNVGGMGNFHERMSPDIYRRTVKSGDLNSFRVVIQETDLLVSAYGDLEGKAVSLVQKYRRQIERYIEGHPEFLRALDPVVQDESAPDIVKTMIDAASKARVGPMASVAGVIAEYVGSGLLPYSSEIIVENGGDIFLRSSKKREIMLLAESSAFVGLRIGIPPSPNPIGVCTSSGLLGHSLSLGKADAVMIVARSASLADAAATALANIVKGSDDIERAIQVARKIGVEGSIIVAEGKMGAWGNVEILG